MNDIFRPHLDRFIVVYLDDILIYSRTAEEHKQQVAVILQLLRDHQLYARLSKCEFARNRVEFLGHIVTDHGITVEPQEGRGHQDVAHT